VVWTFLYRETGTPPPEPPTAPLSPLLLVWRVTKRCKTPRFLLTLRERFLRFTPGVAFFTINRGTLLLAFPRKGVSDFWGKLICFSPPGRHRAWRFFPLPSPLNSHPLFSPFFGKFLLSGRLSFFCFPRWDSLPNPLQKGYFANQHHFSFPPKLFGNLPWKSKLPSLLGVGFFCSFLPYLPSPPGHFPPSKFLFFPGIWTALKLEIFLRCRSFFSFVKIFFFPASLKTTTSQPLWKRPGRAPFFISPLFNNPRRFVEVRTPNPQNKQNLIFLFFEGAPGPIFAKFGFFFSTGCKDQRGSTPF